MSNWTRAQLKDRAKQVLKVNYWIAFVVSLILSFSIGSSTGGGVGGRGQIGFNYEYNSFISENSQFAEEGTINAEEFITNLDLPRRSLFIGTLSAAALMAFLFSMGLSVFLLNPLAVGCYKFYSSSAKVPHSDMGPVGIAFQKGNYWGIVKGMFLKNLYIFLWTLLFIIPGIIKAYSYRMVPYILADNPQMDTSEALALSSKMMNGEKMEAFVLDLSFIGWYMLGALAFGVGVLFVNPYKFSTDAQLYLVLKDKNAIEA